MAARQVLTVSSARSFPHHPLASFGQIQTQAMSHAKFIFLIALVIFFVVLFVAAYVWMRRPDFGQKGGRPIASPAGALVQRPLAVCPVRQGSTARSCPRKTRRCPRVRHAPFDLPDAHWSSLQAPLQDPRILEGRWVVVSTLGTRLVWIGLS